MIHCGKGAANSALKARILLKTDESENGPGWSDERIAKALETSLLTVLRTRRQFVEEGFDAALSRKKSFWSPPRTFDGEAVICVDAIWRHTEALQRLDLGSEVQIDS